MPLVSPRRHGPYMSTRMTNRWSLLLTLLPSEEPPHYIPPLGPTSNELTLAVFTAEPAPFPLQPLPTPPPSLPSSLPTWQNHRNPSRMMTPPPNSLQIKRESPKLQYLSRLPSNTKNAGSAPSIPMSGPRTSQIPEMTEMMMEGMMVSPQPLSPTPRQEVMMEWPLLPLPRRSSSDQGSNGNPPMTEVMSESRVQVESNPPLITVAINYGGIDLARTAMLRVALTRIVRGDRS